MPVFKNSKFQLVSLLLLATALRLFRLDAQSVWFDEAARLLIARGDIATILRTTGGDTLPPLYHLILHFWQLVGTQDFWTRLPSVFANVLFIAVMFKLGEHLFDHIVGFFAAAITAVLPYLIFHSQQANLYSLFVLFAGLQTLLFWKIQYRPTKMRWVAYILVNLAALYIHYFAIFIILVTHFYLLWQKQLNLKIILADVAIALGYLPYVAIFLSKAQEVSSGFWLSVPLLLEPFLTLYLFIGSYSVSGSAYIVGLCLVLALLMITLLEIRHRAKQEPEQKKIFLFLTLLTFLPLILVWIISQWLPIYLSRTLLIVLPSYVLLLAYGIAHTHRRSPLPYIAALTLFFLTISLYNYFESSAYWKPDYRAAATAVTTTINPSTNHAIVHTSNGSYIPFLVYLPPTNHYLLDGDPAPHHPPAVYENVNGSTISQADLSRFDEITVVVALDHSIEYQEEVVKQLDATYNLIASMSVDGIIIRTYEIPNQ